MTPAPILTHTNHKGGVTKTTTTVNLAAELGELNYKVLVVDCDAQANATQHLSKVPIHLIGTTLLDLMLKGSSLLPEVLHEDTYFPNVSLIPSKLDLEDIDTELPRFAANPNKQLFNVIQPILPMFDLVILDSPPSLAMMAKNVMAAATDIIIPVGSASPYDLYGIDALLGKITMMRGINPNMKLHGALMTRYDERVQLTDSIQESLLSKVKFIIPIKISSTQKSFDSVVLHKSIRKTDRRNRVGAQYQQYAKYIVDLLGLEKIRAEREEREKQFNTEADE